MNTNKEILESIDYAQVLTKQKDDVRASRLRAARAVNTELILLYHRIGTYISKLQEEQGWGSKVIQQLSKDLKSMFPDMKGFSERNLKYMRKFAFEYPDAEFVQQAVAQLPWSHICIILTALQQRRSKMVGHATFYLYKLKDICMKEAEKLSQTLMINCLRLYRIWLMPRSKTRIYSTF